jgi:hypothetical protein
MFRRNRSKHIHAPEPSPFYFAPSVKRYSVSISRAISIPDNISGDDRQALIQNGLEQLRQSVQQSRDVIYSSLLVAAGGLATFSIVLLGTVITLGSLDVALQISLSAFAAVVPLLAASYWSLKIWYTTLDARPEAHSGLTKEQQERLSDSSHFSSGEFRGDSKEYAVFITTISYAQLLTFIPVSFIALVGVASILWHAFWIASVIFVVAVALGCSFITWSFEQRSTLSFFDRHASFFDRQAR